jgi:hypothetical protein
MCCTRTAKNLVDLTYGPSGAFLEGPNQIAG